MLAILSNILIVNPLILTALAALPILWFLLRVTPPAPKLVEFPATRFLIDLIPNKVSPSKTPLWLLLLRLIIAALVIFALAQPIYNPSQTLSGNAQVRLVINNDWGSAHNWDKITKTAGDILSQAERQKRETSILITAPSLDQQNQGYFEPMAASDALAILKGLKPNPWASDYITSSKVLKSLSPQDNTLSIFLSSGLNSEGFDDFLNTLRSESDVLFFNVDDENLPIILKNEDSFSLDLQTALITPQALPSGLPLSIQARAQDGRILDSQSHQTSDDGAPISFDIPELLRNEIGQYSVAGYNSAAATYLLDDRHKKRVVGIAAEEDESDTSAALTQDATYIRKAIEPYTQLRFGTIIDLLEQKPSMMILPDIAAIPSQTLNALEKWIDEGGVLLRFAGPNMTESMNTPYLVPVPIRGGARALDGALSWENPLTLAEFPTTSPFYGLEIPQGITVKKQMLAEPVVDLDEKTWATLEDGTPLITADKKGDGLIVLVHTTASPEWSNLPLSGLFINILRRLVTLSGKASASVLNENSILEPLFVMDGYGALKQADSSIKPIAYKDFETMDLNANHPPGIYGQGGQQRIVNIGDKIEQIETIQNLPLSLSVQTYDKNYELDLRPFLLYAALCLLIIDWLIMLALSTGFHRFSSMRRSAVNAALTLIAFGVIFANTSSAFAQSPVNDEEQFKYAQDLHLAYIRTGDSQVDNTSQKGLEILAQVLTRRTSAEPSGVVGLEPDSDILPFFPLIYWPISNEAAPLSTKAINNVQHYLDHGGTILFDTRDQNFTAGSLGGTPNADALRRLVGNLNIPPLEPSSKDHVLTKSFYLLEVFPGKYTGGTLWVESGGSEGRDGVSSVIIGSHDWASSWASHPMNRNNIYGTNRQEELALRFGVNLMMYALTGNYKADQVHVPHILERLGQ